MTDILRFVPRSWLKANGSARPIALPLRALHLNPRGSTGLLEFREISDSHF
jgi:hypothetical protein